MGRDVSVYCRCWEDGLTTEPPVPRDLLEPVDRSDPYRQAPSLRDDDAVTREMKLAFHAWMQRPCAHERMDVLTERIWKWTGTSVYSRVVHTLGDSWLPVLASVDYGYGREERPMPSDEAGAALAELDLLCEYASETELGELTEAVDVVTGNQWWQYLDGQDGLVYQAPPWGIGLDAGGLFLWDLKAPDERSWTSVGALAPTEVQDRGKAGRHELFRATRLSVRIGSPVNDPAHGHHVWFQHATAGPCDCAGVTFTNLDTGERLSVPMAHQGEPFIRDRHFRAWTRPIILADLHDVVSALRRIFRAAVDARTAVVWW